MANHSLSNTRDKYNSTPALNNITTLSAQLASNKRSFANISDSSVIEETRWGYNLNNTTSRSATEVDVSRYSRFEFNLDSIPLDWSVKSRIKIFSETPFHFLTKNSAQDEFQAMQAFLHPQQRRLLTSASNSVKWRESLFQWIHPAQPLSVSNPVMLAAQHASMKAQSSLNTSDALGQALMDRSVSPALRLCLSRTYSYSFYIHMLSHQR